MERTNRKKGWSRWKEPSIRKVGADRKNKHKKCWNIQKEQILRKVGPDGKNKS